MVVRNDSIFASILAKQPTLEDPLKPDSSLHHLVRPFLKWPGGKFRLISTIKSYLPHCQYLIEPFVGAGALFLNTDHPQVIINDLNFDLINLYQQLYQRKKYISDAQKLFKAKNNNAKTYYHLRDYFNSSQDHIERAILFLYLNRHGYNGLCRYNLQGGYNVPFGNYRRPYFPEIELEKFIQQMQKVTLFNEGYAQFMKRFLKESHLEQMVFYCDPPYAPLSKTANFTGYAAQRFTLEDQIQLAEIARTLTKKGATVLISNHDTPFTRKLYHDAELHRIEVTRTISCQITSRQKVGEIIALFASSRFALKTARL